MDPTIFRILCALVAVGLLGLIMMRRRKSAE